MSDCCNDFAQSVTTVEREPNPIWRAHDDCGYKAVYKGLVGSNYPRFMPVKAGAAPGTVEPAPDGVDAIGVTDTAKAPVVLGAEGLTIIRHAADISWADMAPAVGELATDQAAWWAVHVELAKIGVFVSF